MYSIGQETRHQIGQVIWTRRNIEEYQTNFSFSLDSLFSLSNFLESSRTTKTATPSYRFSLLPPLHHSSAENVVSKKKVEDVMPIATGHEREELQAELEGRNILNIDFPEGPFGTKESPAVVKSYYEKRIVGCPGVEGVGSGWPRRTYGRAW